MKNLCFYYSKFSKKLFLAIIFIPSVWTSITLKPCWSMEAEIGDSSRNRARPKCLRFLNNNQAPDQINFLYSNYKNNKKIMNESNICAKIDRSQDLFELQRKFSGPKTNEAIILELMSPFSLSAYDPRFFH